MKRKYAPPVPTASVVAWFMLLGAAQASAMDFQVHGFASQGLVLTEGNQLYGDSNHGSLQYYEAGLNTTIDTGHNLLLSAQVLARDAGQTDNGGIRIDYAQADYRFLQSEDRTAGIRFGRVKNPFGLFNDTRDMVFTRPGILLPQSIYLDTVGFRNVMFSSDGLQVYGDTALDDHNISLAVTGGLPRNATREEVRQFGGDSSAGTNVHFDCLMFARILDDIDGGLVQVASSYAHVALSANMTQPAPSDINLHSDIYVLSARLNEAHWNLTGEYLRMDTGYSASPAPWQTNNSDGLYMQFGYLLTPQLSTYLMAMREMAIELGKLPPDDVE